VYGGGGSLGGCPVTGNTRSGVGEACSAILRVMMVAGGRRRVCARLPTVARYREAKKLLS
jgi:hypothetical protein